MSTHDSQATVVRPAACLALHTALHGDSDATVVRAPASGAAGAGPGAPPLPQRCPVALAVGTRLFEYRIDAVLGQGGFGLTYLATDVNLNAPVAVKEYLPEEIAFRAGDRSVMPNASRHCNRYQQGLDAFLVEARTLASFRHRAIVRVARFFEAHRTAYMVMEYERGESFREWWPQQQHQPRLEQCLVDLFTPLCDGLAVVHEGGFLHRDIKPDNIQRRADDGRLVLLDFGSAGQTVTLGEQAMVVVTPGYAPIEQYGLGQEGPWTDVYALAATLYWAVTARKPDDAEARAAGHGRMRSAVDAGRGRYGQAFLSAIDWALHLDAAQRPRSVAEFRRALLADHVSTLGLQEALRIGGDEAADKVGQRPSRWAALRQAWLRGCAPADWPLAWKMAPAMLATALLPMMLTAAYNQRGSLQAVSNAELRFVEQMAHSTAARVAQFVADSRHLARVLATDRAFATFLSAPHAKDAADAAGAADNAGAREALRDKLARVVQANPDLQLVMLMDATGTAVVSSDPQVVGRNFGFRQYFQQAMQGRPYATGLIVGAVAGASGVFYAEPVFAPTAPTAPGGAGDASDARDAGSAGSADAPAVVGALVLRVRGSSVASILDGLRPEAELTTILIDGDGVVIHHPREDLLYRSLVPLPAATLAAVRADQRFRRDRIDSLGETDLAQAMVGARQPGHVSYTSAVTKREQIAGFAPVAGHDWVVGVSESRQRFEAPLQALTTHLLWSVALVGLLFTGLALRFARRIVQPVRELTRAADALKAGQFDQAAVQVRGRDELGQLARTFNVMVDVLRQRERERGP